ncbi:Hypothetical protein AA314_04877 [Archangium gephyra]|uniref:Uncharacterized protein n=1 Tax=Archangium gephyra TaxID=48 RepID=A0AAC8Q964_9BACT|nr:Hypothetical protein AA314_04877 [Archangium gephyra]
MAPHGTVEREHRRALAEGSALDGSASCPHHCRVRIPRDRRRPPRLEFM